MWQQSLHRCVHAKKEGRSRPSQAHVKHQPASALVSTKRFATRKTGSMQSSARASCLKSRFLWTCFGERREDLSHIAVRVSPTTRRLLQTAANCLLAMLILICTVFISQGSHPFYSPLSSNRLLAGYGSSNIPSFSSRLLASSSAQVCILYQSQHYPLIHPIFPEPNSFALFLQKQVCTYVVSSLFT